MPVIDITVFFAITGTDIGCGIILLVSSLVWAVSRSDIKKFRDLHALMSVTQTSLVRDLKSGPAKVAGRVIAKGQTLSSPWSNRKCVYYRFHVEKYISNNSGGGWSTYIDDTAPSSFLVADETGEIEILLSEGQIPGDRWREGQMGLRIDRNSESGGGNDASSQLRNLLKSKYEKDTEGLIFNKKLRYTETYLEPDDKVYVFGQASQADDGRWVMRHGEMPLIVSEKGELDVMVKEEDRINTYEGISIVSVISAVGTVVFWVFSKVF